MGYRSSLTVGILGLIPFVAIFVCCLITPADQEVYDLLIYLFVSYAAIKICTGKTDVSPAIWVIAILSLVSFLVA